MVRRTKLDAEKTRQSLMDAAEILFLEQGVTRTSLDQVARRAGVTRGALYWHFNNKVDLLRGLVDRVDLKLDTMFGDLMRRYQEAPWPDSMSLTDATMDVLKGFFVQLEKDERHQRVLSILINRLELVGEMSGIRDFYEGKAARTVAALSDLIALCKERGEIIPTCDPVKVAAVIHSLMIGVFMDVACTPGGNAIKDAPDLFAVVFDGLRRRVSSGPL
jgi:AcrR family transcriptional regulator